MKQLTSKLATLIFAVTALAAAAMDIHTLDELDAACSDSAARSDPFEVEGLVTGATTEIADTFILTDGSKFMEMTDGMFWPKPVLKAGDRIRASGHVIRQDNDLYNYAKAFKITILSHETPPPPVDATAKEINEGKVLYKIVRVTGTIIDACRDEIDPRFVFLTISSDNETIYANAYHTNEFTRTVGLIGSKVTITGKCFELKPGTNRYNLGPQISFTFPNGMTVIKPGPSDPFVAPPLEGGVADVTRALESDSPWRKVRGRVIAVWHRSNALVRVDPFRVSRVTFADAAPPDVGDEIEAVGIPETDIYNLNLSRAQWRKVECNAAPHDVPEDVTIRFLLADECGRREFKPPYHGRLVRLRGTVQNVVDLGDDGIRLALGDGAFDIAAELRCGSATPDDFQKESKVEVTGVCVMETEHKSAHTPFPRTTGVFIVPRSPDDIVVLASPPWWTPLKFLIVIAVLFAGLLAALVWNFLLQRLSDRKGRELADANIARIASELKVHERTRLATELHDSIVQNLTGASMKLRASGKMFDSKPEESRTQLGLALKTLDSCRDELRNCIWDLRNQALDEPVMDEVLNRVLAPHAGDAKLAVRFAVERSLLSDNAAHAIICIIRELVINAVRHGKAKSIHVAGCLDGDRLLFSAKDDGCGFDTVSSPGPDQGHFGIQGIHERVDALGGKITITSSLGHGSSATISIPLSLP